MQTISLLRNGLTVIAAWLGLFWGFHAGSLATSAAEFKFRHHSTAAGLFGDGQTHHSYGLTALVDLDRDGDLDFVLGGQRPPPERLYWLEYQAPDRWVTHLVGTNYQSDVGLAALDVDRDGWPDLVCSGVWFRNPREPRQRAFERIEFAPKAAGAHDVLAADIDGDRKPDIVMMSDERRSLNAVAWFKIPADPKQPWERHDIGPGIHGAIAPAGVMDVDGDGDADVLRADSWFENQDGHGRAWVAHKNIPFGRVGPYGMCVRTAFADLDGDGKAEVVMADTDIVDSRVAILRNQDGRGGAWAKAELPRSFTYGSIHSLAVADLNGDGRPDIVVNEQEELLPPERQNPRWVAWENLGQGRFAERILLDARLGGHELQAGDVDRDGDIDLCSKPWGAAAWNAAAGKMHVDYLQNLLKSPGR
jgi:hypothetical protein